MTQLSADTPFSSLRSGHALCSSVGLASVSLIAFQLVIMQVLSITQWHHFAYMVISMAMLGFGAAGTFLAIFREKIKRKAGTVIPVLFVLCALSMAASGRLAGLFGDFDTYLLFFDRSQILLMLFSYLVYCLPFFFGGLAITAVFYVKVAEIGKLYFYNLAGSALGGIGVIGLMWIMPVHYLSSLLSFLPLAAAWLIAPPDLPLCSHTEDPQDGESNEKVVQNQKQPGGRRKKFYALLWAGSFFSLFTLYMAETPSTSEYKDIYRALQLPESNIILEDSSPYGLLQAVHSPYQRFAPALSLQYRGTPPVRDVLFNNGDYFGTLLGIASRERTANEPDEMGALSGIASRERTANEPDEMGALSGVGTSEHTISDPAGTVNSHVPDHILDFTTRGFPFAIRKPDSVLVLQAGTGSDVSHALYHGARHITAVESNRSVIRLLYEKHPEWIDSLYHLPRVELDGRTPRTWLAGARRTGSGYDLILLPVIGSFGGTSGIFALQEQYEFTLQAFSKMWDLLNPKGMISVTLWSDYPPRASLKLMASWRSSLEDRLNGRAEDHILAIRSWGTITFVVSPAPFTDRERENARRFARELSFDPLLFPDIRPGERDYFNQVEDPSLFAYLDTLLTGNPEPLLQGYAFNIRPATDDRPFFSQYMNLRGISELYHTYGAAQLPYLELGFIMAVVTLIQILIAAFILILAPLFRVGWQGTRRRWTFLYFSGTGIGFMFFEMVLIQKLVLYLGQPVYATAAVITALLLFSGAGSYYSTRLQSSRMRLAATGLLIAVLILAYGFLLMPLLEVSISWPRWSRFLLVMLLLSPPAFYMGMMFPLGLRRLYGSNETQIPWACGVDSCLSVTATALATLIALETGFIQVMMLAASAYMLTALAALRLGLKNR